MNERWWIMKMAYKRQTAVLSVVFVLVGMMFLVPAITEKALARTEAVAYPPAFSSFFNVRTHLDAGKFIQEPPEKSFIPGWVTAGTGLFGGDEKGYVQYDVKDWGTATFYFYNPNSGSNTCNVVADPKLQAKCSITQGNFAQATYLLCLPETVSCNIKHPGLSLLGPIHLPSITGHRIYLPLP